MQSANSRKGDDAASGRMLNRASDRGVSIERHVWPVLVVIGRMLPDQAKQMAFAKHNHVVEEFAPKGADPSFRISVLPGGTRRNLELIDTHMSDAHVECGTVDAIAVSNQISRYNIGADGFDNLLRSPLGVRVGCHVNVKYTASIERKNEEDISDVERHGRDGRKIDRDRSREMIANEGLPGLRRRLAWTR